MMRMGQSNLILHFRFIKKYLKMQTNNLSIKGIMKHSSLSTVKKVIFCLFIFTLIGNVFAACNDAPTPGVNWDGCSKGTRGSDLDWFFDKKLPGVTMRGGTLTGWKDWRQKSSVEKAIFSTRESRANFENATLLGYLAYADFTGAVFLGSKIGKDNSDYVTEFEHSNLTNANLSYVNWTGVKGHHVIFNEADISHAYFENSDLRHSDFRDLVSGYAVNFNTADLRDTGFSSTKPEKRNNLASSSFINAKLQGADLSNVNFRDANFRGAIFGSTPKDPILIFLVLLGRQGRNVQKDLLGIVIL